MRTVKSGQTFKYPKCLNIQLWTKAKISGIIQETNAEVSHTSYMTLYF